MNPIALNITLVDDGFVTGKRFFIHDRDPRFTLASCETLAAADVQAVRLPPRSPISMRTRGASCGPSRNHVWNGSSSSAKRRSDEQCVSSWTITIMNATIRAWATG